MKTTTCVSLVNKQLHFSTFLKDDMAVLIETSLGDITVDLFTEERPRGSLNFLKLCKTKYYNFCLFHSVQRNLVAQTGDPTGTGKGGQSVFADLYGEQAVYFDMETVPRIKHRQKGLVSMVNNGNNGHGSQFFFTLGDDLDYLDGVHTVIGEVAEGLDILDKINEAYCDEQHRPYKDIRIYHTIILDDPFPNPDGLVVPDKSPEPTKEQLDSGRIGADEDIDDTKGLTVAELQESLEKKEAQANAQILEMVGDLPEVDVKPPDTVLFVCKLNPVTTSEDLEIIFSRFGTILSCEVIKEQKTEESLQYAFIEFEKPEDCESAYFKMDNVLIDDRRIHVDFSQSVSKLKFPDGKEEGKQGSFGSQYKIKDTSKKDHKYDLVFEDDNERKSQKRKNDDKGNDRKRRKSRSRSRDRSPRGRQNKRSRSKSPKRDRDADRRYKDDKSRDNGSKDKRYQENHKQDKYRDVNCRNKRRGSSAESLSDQEMEEDDRSSNKFKNKSSKTYRKKGSESSNSDSNHRRNKIKSNKSNTRDVKRREKQSDAESSSDDLSKTKKKSTKSYRKKSKHDSSGSESDNATTKPKHRRGDSRERNTGKYERKDRGNNRDFEDKSHRSKDFDRHKDRNEKRHKNRH